MQPLSTAHCYSQSLPTTSNCSETASQLLTTTPNCLELLLTVYNFWLLITIIHNCSQLLSTTICSLQQFKRTSHKNTFFLYFFSHIWKENFLFMTIQFFFYIFPFYFFSFGLKPNSEKKIIIFNYFLSF